jgi:hypothetical protein
MPPITIEEISDPIESTEARCRRERFDRNAAAFQRNADIIYRQHRGKCVCIAGGEIFVADTPEEAMTIATAAHPEDNGSFVQYVPLQRFARVYAN